MSVAVFDGHDAISCSIALPFLGVGTVQVEIDLDEVQSLTPPAGTVSLVIAVEDRPPVVYTVTILDVIPLGDAGRESLGRFRVFAVQGSGLMRQEIPGLDYADVAPRLVAEDVTVGEDADLASLASLPSLPSWRRPKGPPKAGLTRLVQRLALDSSQAWGWRVAPGGAVTVAIETWAAYAYTTAGSYEEEPDAYGIATLMLAAPDLLPGMTIDRPEDRPGDRLRVQEIVYQLDGDKFRARARLGGNGAAVPTRDIFQRAVASVLPPLRLMVPHFASVVDQDAAGLLGLRLDGDDPPLLTLSNVPIWPGVPGRTLTIPLGARCVVTFVGGSEQTPIVTGWESAGTFSEEQIGDGTARPVVKSIPDGIWKAAVKAALSAIGVTVPDYADLGTAKLRVQ